jgi:Flp pilus assembly protein TadB
MPTGSPQTKVSLTMAQTKRKRRSKHRGNAAGTIEARGRTGRPPSAEEKKKQQRVDAREKRLNTPPTWRSAGIRAAFAAVIMFGFLLFTTKGHNVLTAVSFAVLALLLYLPAGYYLEVYLFRRRQRRKVTGP